MKKFTWMMLALTVVVATAFGDDENREPAAERIQKTVKSSVTTTTSSSSSSGSEEPYGKTSTSLGLLKLGPQLTLIGAVVPVRLGVDAKYDNLLGLGLDYGFVPAIGITRTMSVGLSGMKLNARLFPWRNAFFFGLGVGSQSASLTETGTVNGTDVKLTLNTTATTLVPHVGWKWEWPSGFFMGMEVGVQFGLGATATASTDLPANSPLLTNPTYLALKDDIEGVGRSVSSMVLPYLTLLQLGYLF